MAKHFPQLQILECLGRGGMGVVYKARQPKLKRLVALKILAPERGSDPKFSERFEREAQTLARLSHPHIVAVHDFGEADGIYYLLMEYVDGRSLRDILRSGTITPEQALAIVPSICEALQFAHEHGVVHRDIKPENVLLDQQGRVKIADFGIAKLVGDERRHQALTEDRQVIGTPHYMAPEQVEKPQLVDHRADIYSLGVVFYEMLTGELPLGKFAPPSRKVVVDVRLDEVVLHALEKEPEQRYQKAGEVKTDLEGITSGRSAPRSEPQRQLKTAILPKSDSRSPDPAFENDQRTKKGGLPAVPAILWVAIVTMIGAAIWKQLAFPRNPWWLLADGLLVAGLIYRFKFAYAAALFFALLGVVFTAFSGASGLAMIVLLLNGLVAVPVLLSTGWFFSRVPLGNLWTGGDLVTGIVASLPPVAWVWFVRGGYGFFGMDLDADVRLFVAAGGLPVSAVGGVLLAIGAKPLLSGFECSAPRADASTPARQWSLWAVAAAFVWTLSLPLGGGAIIMFDLMRQDPSWNPATGEAIFVLTLATLTPLTIAAGVVLGATALQRMRKNATQSRGWLGAVAATWVWPFLLCSLLSTSSRTSDAPSALEATQAAKMEQARLDALRKAEAARGFEPIREIVLRRGSALQDAFLNLETGQILSAPTNLVQTLKASGRLSTSGTVQVLPVLDWMRENGADLICRPGPNGITLVDGANLLMSEHGSHPSTFDSLEALEVGGAADMLAEPLALHTNREPMGLAITWFDVAEGTNTWALRTRSGRAGLLELRADRVQPDHIRFRYKLVSQSTPPPSAPFLGPSMRR
jgi:tRNA A-37 threonylcarbamoyl transferase component Bud32